MEGVEKAYLSALTVDVEDGVNIAMKDFFNVRMEPTDRVISNMDIILKLFEKNSVKATFFILGEVVEKYPELLKRIDQAGHEVGVHGYNHDQIFRLTPERLKMDLSRAKIVIEDIIGKQVNGYRAPAFSINQNTSWALPIIAKVGFTYDSSIFPSISLRYGWQGFSKDICRLNMEDYMSLIEVPLSVSRMAGRDVPVGGGGYLRYFPLWWTRKSMAGIIRERPAIVYFHPYELDTEKYPDFFYKAIASAPLKKQMLLRFYRYNKDTVETKLDRLTKEFEFAPMIKVIQRAEEQKRVRDISFIEGSIVDNPNQTR